MVQEKIRKVLTGALIAAAGAALTYASEWVSQTDFGAWTPAVVAAASTAVNALRKLLSGDA